MNKPRYLENVITSICFTRNKMAFISGPRQAGKTTLAKRLLEQHKKQGEYFNWDDITFRREWANDPNFILNSKQYTQPPLIILDEIHKAKLWKQSLKGVYDTNDKACHILVTGSARLNTYRKGSDSLLGRYYLFNLHPFSLLELIKKPQLVPVDQIIERLFTKALKISSQNTDALEQLFTFGPFPEPLLAGSTKILNLWQRNRTELIIREDLRDLSKLPELGQIEMLTSLLPERASNPLSIQSLSTILEAPYTTIKRWLTYLYELYYCFEIKPFSKSLPRTLKKEGKLYLWDWSEIKQAGSRFENLIACHLLKYCNYLTDTGEGSFKLCYLKNKEKKEIDFLIVKDGEPWLPIEAKLSETTPSSNWPVFLKHLSCKYAIQIVKTSGVFKIFSYDDCEILVVSADYFLSYLI